MAAWDVADEVLHVVVRRRADKLLRRAELDDLAVAHDRDPVAEPQRLRQVVRNEKHRLSGLDLQAADLVLHVAADQRVERAERLVVEHHLRVDGESAGETDALLHTARELVRELVRAVLEADELQHLGCSRQPLRLGDALHLEPERDVVDHAPVRKQTEMLEDHRRGMPTELPQLDTAQCDDILAVDLDVARGGLDEPDQRAYERRFAGAGEPHDDEHLSRPDVERDIADGGDAIVLLPQFRARKVGVGRSDHAIGAPAKDLPNPACADERYAAPVDVVTEGAGGIHHHRHGLTVLRWSAPAKIRKGRRSFRRRRYRR